MRTLLVLMLVTVMVAVVAACGPRVESEADGVVIPEPREGQQYSITELCGHLGDEGLDVSGSFRHTFAPDDFETLLDNLPALVRTPVANYLSDGLALQVTVTSLCKTVN